MPEPIKLIMAAEFGSTVAAEISLFHRLSAGNGRNPLRLALWPRLIPLQLGGGFPPVVDVTCKFWDDDVALPGLGFITATAKFPADDSLPVAVSCVDDTKVVASGAPARSTSTPLTNPAPLTVIANDPAGTDAGAMPARTGTGFCKVTELLPEAVASAELTALTVIMLEPAIVIGAAYKPDELIVPAAALPPATPLTCQVTEVFDDPATVALKDCVAPARTFALDGETVTVTPDPEGGVFVFELDEVFVTPAQPAKTVAAAKSKNGIDFRKVRF